MSRAMKDSGVAWIGEIPEGIGLKKLKFCTTVLSGFPFDSAKFTSTPGFPLIRIRDITSGTIETYYSGEYDPSFIVRDDDLLVGMDGDFNVRWWSAGEALLNQRCCKIEMLPGYSKRFVFYCLPLILTRINDLTYSTTVKHLSVGDIGNSYIPDFSLAEQSRIAVFLDRRCAEIDRVIAATQRTIEEYKKLKLSIITEAVTHGVRGERKMKDSGVEWIGEIPEEWEIHKLCWDYEAMLGKMLDAKRITGDNLHPYIKNIDVQWWSISFENLDEMDFSDDEYERYSIKTGDLIVCEGGEIGKCAVVPNSAPEGIFYQKALHRIRQRKPNVGNVYFLSYVIFTMAKQNAFETTHDKATIQHLPGDALSQLRIPTPDTTEQSEIVDYLKSKCAEIDDLISAKQQLLTQLEAYKKSVIYEYVTGKREVPTCQ